MTRRDIEHLAQVTHSLRSKLIVGEDTQEFDQFIDRMLWAIRASNRNPAFDERRFRKACAGDGFEIFRPEDPVA